MAANYDWVTAMYILFKAVQCIFGIFLGFFLREMAIFVQSWADLTALEYILIKWINSTYFDLKRTTVYLPLT